MCSIRPTKTDEEIDRRLFRAFDSNSDGKISAAEFKAVMDKLGECLTIEEIRKMIDMVDADGDG
jgi:Ca2+-binding EF-hand superfamily protein